MGQGHTRFQFRAFRENMFGIFAHVPYSSFCTNISKEGRNGETKSFFNRGNIMFWIHKKSKYIVLRTSIEDTLVYYRQTKHFSSRTKVYGT